MMSVRAGVISVGMMMSGTTLAQQAPMVVDGVQYSLETQTCQTGEGSYQIEARGEGATVSVVGNDSYSSVDILLLAGGSERRITATADFVELTWQRFMWVGSADASDGKPAAVSLVLDAC